VCLVFSTPQNPHWGAYIQPSPFDGLILLVPLLGGEPRNFPPLGGIKGGSKSLLEKIIQGIGAQFLHLTKKIVIFIKKNLCDYKNSHIFVVKD
jgi:hypothetical protein